MPTLTRLATCVSQQHTVLHHTCFLLVCFLLLLCFQSCFLFLILLDMKLHFTVLQDMHNCFVVFPCQRRNLHWNKEIIFCYLPNLPMLPGLRSLPHQKGHCFSFSSDREFLDSPRSGYFYVQTLSRVGGRERNTGRQSGFACACFWEWTFWNVLRAYTTSKGNLLPGIL